VLSSDLGFLKAQQNYFMNVISPKLSATSALKRWQEK
jgi:hypothetical protein